MAQGTWKSVARIVAHGRGLFVGALILGGAALQFGVPMDFVLFGLTLAGVALFHRHVLWVALIGLAVITPRPMSATHSTWRWNSATPARVSPNSTKSTGTPNSSAAPPRISAPTNSPRSCAMKRAKAFHASCAIPPPQVVLRRDYKWAQPDAQRSAAFLTTSPSVPEAPRCARSHLASE